MVLPLVLLGQESSSTSTSSSSRTFTVKETSDAHLFEPSAAIRVSAPTVFPKPTDKIMNIDQHHRPDEVKPMIRPVLGRHRAHCDAILAYAEGYPLPVYMMFLETLRATGFTGDVVLAIADASIVREQVIPYLTTLALATDAVADDGQMHVVVYQLAMDCDSIDGKVGRNILPRSGDTDAFQMCRLNHVYGWDDGTMAPDPRLGRVVATLRYEWYWIWSLRYQANSWLLLLDSRDSFFQSNPFADLPRTVLDPEGGMTEGLLYFFGENASATRLGISTKNRRWISVGYGERTMEAIQEKPTICSGSTMGERIAIETYLRAMVNEHDEANVRMTGTYRTAGQSESTTPTQQPLLFPSFRIRPGFSQLPVLQRQAASRVDDSSYRCVGAGHGHCQQSGRDADQASRGVGHVRSRFARRLPMGRRHPLTRRPPTRSRPAFGTLDGYKKAKGMGK